jgi:hypothetical protein
MEINTKDNFWKANIMERESTSRCMEVIIKELGKMVFSWKGKEGIIK